MSLLDTLARAIRDRSRFDYQSRRQLIEQIVAVEDQRDRAIAQARATRDQLAGYLERHADGHDHDARVKGLTDERRDFHRAVATTLRDAARDCDLEAR